LKFINLSDITLKYDSHKLTFSPKLLVRHILGAQKYTIYIIIMFMKNKLTCAINGLIKSREFWSRSRWTVIVEGGGVVKRNDSDRTMFMRQMKKAVDLNTKILPLINCTSLLLRFRINSILIFSNKKHVLRMDCVPYT
jgi:hypothetical protein